MSARLTEEKVADMQTYASTRLDGVRQQGGAEGQLESDLLALIADRAAILESERDLLAALEHEGHGPADDPGCPDMPDAHAVMVLHPGGRYEWRSCEGCAAVANARKQDAPTGAGGGKQ